MLLGPLSFALGRRPGLFTTLTKAAPRVLGLITPAGQTPWGYAFLRWSFLMAPSWLVELGGVELPTPFGRQGLDLALSHLTWALVEVGGKERVMWLQLGQSPATAEAFFRNARWLEREVGEMTGAMFAGKRDKRSLFGLPIFYSNPLRKAFPCGGVFDLGLCPLTHKLTFRHVS